MISICIFYKDSDCKQRLENALYTINHYNNFQIEKELIVIEQESKSLQGVKCDKYFQSEYFGKMSIANLRNNCIKQASNEIIFMVDADMIVDEENLIHGIEVVRNNKDSFYNNYNRSPKMTDSETKQKFFKTGVLNHHECPYRGDNMWEFFGGTLIGRKDDFMRIGGFNETFVSYGEEDNDFRERAIRMGFRFLKSPNNHFAFHLDHPPSVQRGDWEYNPDLRKDWDRNHRISRNRKDLLHNPNHLKTLKRHFFNPVKKLNSLHYDVTKDNYNEFYDYGICLHEDNNFYFIKDLKEKMGW